MTASALEICKIALLRVAYPCTRRTEMKKTTTMHIQ